MKRFFLLLAFSLFATLAFAQGMENLKNALTQFCSDIKSMIPVVVFLMIVCGGIVYAAGQVFGAEVRSRANVWATAMIIGSLICVLLVLIVPQLLANMYGDPNADFSC